MGGTIPTIRGAGAALLLATGWDIAAANVLVVRSIGPSAEQYRPGRSLGLDDPITLRNGDRIVLLSDRGTRMFVGPGTFRPSQPGAARPRMHGTAGVAEAASPTARARIGAARGFSLVARSTSPSIWHVEVGAGDSGRICLPSAEGARLARPALVRPARVTVSGPGGEADIEWPADRTTLPWPAAVPIANDARYRITLPGETIPTSVQIRLIGEMADDLQTIAGTLILNRCQRQLDQLVDSLPAD